MKFIHAADLHLDSSPSKIKKLYKQNEISITQASHKAFASLVDYAIEKEVDFVVLSGDVFDANWKDYGIGLFFIEQIKKIDCPIYYIRGNHDSENRLFKSLPFPKNLSIFKSENPETILNEKLKVAIHGQSYKKFHIQDDLALNYPVALSGYFNIGLLHTSGEKSNREDHYAPYDQKELLKKKYDYWALGHIHASQIISNEPYIVYSGIIQGRHVKETGVKGCYLVTVENNQVESLEFKRLGDIQWELISLNISQIQSETAFKKCLLEKIKMTISKYPKEIKFVIRFIFEGGNSLDKRICENKDYYINAIYCWMSDTFEHTLYIEKIVDQTQYQSKQDKKERNEIWSYIKEELSKKTSKEEIEKIAQEESSFLLDKIPFKVLNEINNEELISKNKNSTLRIDHYLESKISRWIHEDSTS